MVLVFIIALLAAGLFIRSRFVAARSQLAEEQSALRSRLEQEQSRVATLERVSKPGEHVEKARALAAFRESATPPPLGPFEALLKAHAYQLKAMLGRASGRGDSNLHVIVFAVLGDQSRADDLLKVVEVAATRKPRDIPFLNVRRNTNVYTVVGCAVAERAFILWTGESQSGSARTDKIEAWDLWGNPTGTFLPGVQGDPPATPGAFKIGGTACWYTRGEKDDKRRRMLCAPAGMDDNAASGRVTGAVCISAEEETNLLSETWVQHALIHFGDSLSFASWEAAFPTPAVR